MKTPLEERFKKLGKPVIGTCVNCGQETQVHEACVKCISGAEQIAIGFSIWTEKNGWDWSGNHQVFINDDFEPKEASELFKDYMESLKP
jgi:hypothetical protein